MSSPSLKDLAQAAGVSKSTAQRAMSNDPRCAIETREKVQKTAAEMGYRPNPIFSSMGFRNEHKRLDGVPLAYLDVVMSEEKAAGTSYFPAASKRAFQLGYNLQHFNIGEWECPEQVWKVLYARGFAGILLGRVHARDLPLLKQNELFPVVCCGRLDALPYHMVRPSILRSMHWLWRKLAAMGYRRIGAAIGRHEPAVEDDFSRYASVLACQAETEGESEAIPPFLGFPASTKELGDWAKKYRPDVVIGFHTGQYYALHDAGFTIPEELGYVALHSDSTSELKICSLNQNYFLIGECAVNLLDQLIRHGERGLPENPLNVIVEPSWIDGRTLVDRMAVV